MKVLIVDDHDLFRGGLVNLFNSQPDFEVVGEAGTVKEAYSLVETCNPDLILMDLGLPDGSGIEAMSKILQKKPGLKIVFLTIHSSDESAFTAIRSGAKGFLLKNITAPRLLAALRGLERGELAVSRIVLSRFMDEILPLLSPASGNENKLQVTLTRRELEILAELTTGESNELIASRLSISENTLKVHIHNILHKLELTSRYEAAEYGRRHGMAKETRDWRLTGIV